MVETQRVDPFGGNLDLSDFKPSAPKKPKIEPAAIREVSEANNFPSRAAPAKPKAETAAKSGAGGQRRRRTGRNVQFNIKTTPDVIERFTKLADKKGWVFGELLEHALDALEKSSESA
jgi:hypothetical protein